MPVAESMACGTPVLASNASSLPEAAGDAGILIDPLDVTAWSTAIQEMAAQPQLRAQMRERGLVQAAKFSWDACADQTLTVCRNAELQ